MYTSQTHHIHDKNNGGLAEWNPGTHPPFHTLVFPSDVFFNGKKHREFYGNYESHEDVPRMFYLNYVEGRNYCVLAHDISKQISTTWNHPFRGKNVKDNILKDFGL